MQLLCNRLPGREETMRFSHRICGRNRRYESCLGRWSERRSVVESNERMYGHHRRYESCLRRKDVRWSGGVTEYGHNLV